MLRCPCALEDACNDGYSHKTICVLQIGKELSHTPALFNSRKAMSTQDYFDHWDRTVTLAVMYLEIKPQKKKVFVFAPFQCAAVNLKP